MTKLEKTYFKSLVNLANVNIQGVNEGWLWADIYRSNAERLAVIQSISLTIEPLAKFIGEKVIEVDTRHLERENAQ